MRFVFVAASLAALSVSATANDTSVQLTTQGLEFIVNDDIAMQSEDLFISADEIRVKYVFRNDSDKDIKQIVAFPMPDIVYDPEGPKSYPWGPLDNLFQFETTFDGEQLPATLYEYAFVAGVDRSSLLKRFDLPLVNFADEVLDQLNELGPNALAELQRVGLIYSEERETSEGTKWVDSFPLWVYRATYVWEATFPANDTVTVEHRYVPSVGGTIGTSVLYEGGDDSGWNPEEDYKKYCVDDQFKAAVRKSMKPGDDWAPYSESWISYILSTGNNWRSGAIENFRLVVDKGEPENLISFCGEDVKKIGPTTFEMVKQDYWVRNELDILILDKYSSD